MPTLNRTCAGRPVSRATIPFPDPATPEPAAERKPAAAPESDTAPDSDTAPKLTLRASRRRLLGIVAVLVASGAVWFAPDIVARTPLRHRLISVVLPQYPGTAQISSASLGWFRPVVVRGVTLNDADGRVLLTVAELRSEKNLRGLLTSNALGTLTLTSPRLDIRLRRDGSNLEDALEPLLAGSGEAVGLTVVVADGQITWSTQEPSASTGVATVSGSLQRGVGASWPEHCDLSGTLSDGEHLANWSLRYGRVAGDDGATASTATLTATDLPLAPLAPWLDRLQPGVSAAGTLSLDLHSRLASNAWTTQGRIEGRRLRLAASTGSHDVLLLEHLAVTGSVAGSATDPAGTLVLRKVELNSNVGTATADGSMRPQDWAAGWLDGLESLAFGRSLTVSGSVDLPRLTAALPHTISLRQPIESGTAKFSFTTTAGTAEAELPSDTAAHRQSGGESRCTVSLTVSDMVAGAGPQRLVWRAPLTAQATLVNSAAGVDVEQLKATSDFLSVVGRGGLADGELDASVDLGRLADRLGRFAQLDPNSLAGTARLHIAGRRDPAMPKFSADAAATLKKVRVSVGEISWTESELSVVGKLSGSLGVQRIEQIDAANLRVTADGGDALEVTLTGPLDMQAAGDWPLSATLRGGIGPWVARGQMLGLLPRGSWQADGNIEAATQLILGFPVLTCTDVNIEARNLRWTCGDRTAEEPWVVLAAAVATYDTDASLLTVPTFTLSSDTLGGRGSDLHIPLAGDQPAAGRVEFRGGIGRIARYLLPARPGVWPSGIVGGNVTLSTATAATVADVQLAFEKPVLSRPSVDAAGRTVWETLWRDEQATAAATLRYHHLSDALELRSAKATVTGLTVAATGRIDRLTLTADADLSGTVQYDLGLLSERLPEGVSLAGRSSQPCTLRGPLLSPAGIDPTLTADARIVWDGATLYGVSVGRGELAGRLDRQTLTFVPFDWPVAGGGRLQGNAALELAQTPTLVLAPGRIADDIALTPELCRTWLRYAAPSLADASEVRGKFSLQTSGARLPLADFAASDAAGTLLLGETTAAPGTVVQALVGVAEELRRLSGRARQPMRGTLFAPTQSIACRIARGRIWHDRLELRLGSAGGPALTTGGSVGFDGTLDLVASVPVDVGKAIGDDRVETLVGSGPLRVPLRGTLSRPVPDPAALQGLAGQAADRLIQKQVTDPLRELLAPRRPAKP